MKKSVKFYTQEEIDFLIKERPKYNTVAEASRALSKTLKRGSHTLARKLYAIEQGIGITAERSNKRLETNIKTGIIRKHSSLDKAQAIQLPAGMTLYYKNVDVYINPDKTLTIVVPDVK